MVPSIARSILVHHEIEYPLHRPIHLSTFEEDFYLYTMVTEIFRSSPRYSGSHYLDYFYLTDIHSSISIRRRQMCHTRGIFQRLPLLRRAALWTVTYGVRLPGPVVGRSNKPLDSTSSPPYLAHSRSSASLLDFLSTPHFPTPHGIDTRRRCCMRVAPPV